MPSTLNSIATLSLLALGVSATGCGKSNGVAGNVEPSVRVVAGSAMGGQQPIVGAIVSLLAPGQSGYGSQPSLLATTTTGVGGNFTLPAYTCPAIDTVTYLVVTGGDSGSGLNNSITETALLPRCSQLTAQTFIIVTEATTVAAAYTLAPFATLGATGPTIGTSATNIVGLNNAFSVANNLVDFTKGNARATNSVTGVTLPQLQINTLADILSACVNSNGDANSPCQTLFGSTGTGLAGTANATTWGAAIAIAMNPGKNIGTLFQLATSAPPFQPALSGAPADFALAIAYTGNGISAATTGIAIDSIGNAWISTGEFNATTHVLTEISPAGVYLSGATGFGSAYLNGPQALSINSLGNIYVACAGGNNLVKFNTDGSYNSTINAASFHNPNGVSVGGNDNIWITSFNGTAFTKILDSTQAEDTTNGPFASGTEGVDVSLSETAVWVANYQSQTITRLEYGTFNKTNISVSSTPSGMANDANNNVYATLAHGVAEYSDTGTLISPAAGYQGTSSLVPQSVVIDGLGNIFTSAYVGSVVHGSLLEFNSAGTLVSPAGGYNAAASIPVKPAVPGGIAIDGSGNVWITGDSNGTNVVPTVAEVIGIAAPVVTPRATATANGTIGARP